MTAISERKRGCRHAEASSRALMSIKVTVAFTACRAVADDPSNTVAAAVIDQVMGGTTPRRSPAVIAEHSRRPAGPDVLCRPARSTVAGAAGRPR
jgi:hypothetical protein